MMRSRRWYCWPRMARYTSSSVSEAPIQRGRPKSRLKPRAAPRYSALAEYLGAALGFNLLFGLPLWIGASLTLLLVYLAILGQQYHRLERIILVFLAVIAACYIIELF